LRETKTHEAEDADQGSKVCNKIESFKADFHQRCMCDEIFTSTLRQATMHPTEGLLGDESEKTKELCKQEKIDKVTHFSFYKSMEKIHEEEARGYAQT
jgi:hypothetical protein